MDFLPGAENLDLELELQKELEAIGAVDTEQLRREIEKDLQHILCSSDSTRSGTKDPGASSSEESSPVAVVKALLVHNESRLKTFAQLLSDAREEFNPDPVARTATHFCDNSPDGTNDGAQLATYPRNDSGGVVVGRLGVSLELLAEAKLGSTCSSCSITDIVSDGSSAINEDMAESMVEVGTRNRAEPGWPLLDTSPSLLTQPTSLVGSLDKELKARVDLDSKVEADMGQPSQPTRVADPPILPGYISRPDVDPFEDNHGVTESAQQELSRQAQAAALREAQRAQLTSQLHERAARVALRRFSAGRIWRAWMRYRTGSIYLARQHAATALQVLIRGRVARMRYAQLARETALLLALQKAIQSGELEAVRELAGEAQRIGVCCQVQQQVEAFEGEVRSVAQQLQSASRQGSHQQFRAAALRAEKYSHMHRLLQECQTVFQSRQTDAEWALTLAVETLPVVKLTPLLEAAMNLGVDKATCQHVLAGVRQRDEELMQKLKQSVHMEPFALEHFEQLCRAGTNLGLRVDVAAARHMLEKRRASVRQNMKYAAAKGDGHKIQQVVKLAESLGLLSEAKETSEVLRSKQDAAVARLFQAATSQGEYEYQKARFACVKLQVHGAVQQGADDVIRGRKEAAGKLVRAQAHCGTMEAFLVARAQAWDLGCEDDVEIGERVFQDRRRQVGKLLIRVVTMLCQLPSGQCLLQQLQTDTEKVLKGDCAPGICREQGPSAVVLLLGEFPDPDVLYDVAPGSLTWLAYLERVVFQVEGLGRHIPPTILCKAYRELASLCAPLQLQPVAVRAARQLLSHLHNLQRSVQNTLSHTATRDYWGSLQLEDWGEAHGSHDNQTQKSGASYHQQPDKPGENRCDSHQGPMYEDRVMIWAQETLLKRRKSGASLDRPVSIPTDTSTALPAWPQSVPVHHLMALRRRWNQQVLRETQHWTRDRMPHDSCDDKGTKPARRTHEAPRPAFDTTGRTVSTRTSLAGTTFSSSTGVELQRCLVEANVGAKADLGSVTRLDLGLEELSNVRGLQQWCSSLQVLHLNINKLTSLEGLERLTDLKELSAKDNCLMDLRALAGLTRLHRLALDTNQLTSLQDLQLCCSLRSLSVNDNCVTSLLPLTALTNLHVLLASGNALVNLEGLAACRELQVLEVNRNELTSLEGLERCPVLTTISAAGNLLTSSCLEGLHLPLLQSLNLKGNRVQCVGTLPYLPHLTFLNLQDNHITHLEPLHGLYHLTQLDLSFNKLEGLGLLQALSPLSSLMVLHLNDNPLAQDMHLYLEALHHIMPWLEDVDNHVVPLDNRQEHLVWLYQALGQVLHMASRHDSTMMAIMRRQWAKEANRTRCNQREESLPLGRAAIMMCRYLPAYVRGSHRQSLSMSLPGRCMTYHAGEGPSADVPRCSNMKGGCGSFRVVSTDWLGRCEYLWQFHTVQFLSRLQSAQRKALLDLQPVLMAGSRDKGSQVREHLAGGILDGHPVVESLLRDLEGCQEVAVPAHRDPGGRESQCNRAVVLCPDLETMFDQCLTKLALTHYQELVLVEEYKCVVCPHSSSAVCEEAALDRRITALQCCLRRRLAVRKYQGLKVERAVCYVQAVYRGVMVRRSGLLGQLAEKYKQDLALAGHRQMAAVTIQAFVKGWAVRRRLKAAWEAARYVDNDDYDYPEVDDSFLGLVDLHAEDQLAYDAGFSSVSAPPDLGSISWSRSSRQVAEAWSLGGASNLGPTHVERGAGMSVVQQGPAKTVTRLQDVSPHLLQAYQRQRGQQTATLLDGPGPSAQVPNRLMDGCSHPGVGSRPYAPGNWAAETVTESQQQGSGQAKVITSEPSYLEHNDNEENEDMPEVSQRSSLEGAEPSGYTSSTSRHQRHMEKLQALMKEWGFQDMATAEAYYKRQQRQQKGTHRKQLEEKYRDPGARLKKLQVKVEHNLQRPPRMTEHSAPQLVRAPPQHGSPRAPPLQAVQPQESLTSLPSINHSPSSASLHCSSSTHVGASTSSRSSRASQSGADGLKQQPSCNQLPHLDPSKRSAAHQAVVRRHNSATSSPHKQDIEEQRKSHSASASAMLPPTARPVLRHNPGDQLTVGTRDRMQGEGSGFLGPSSASDISFHPVKRNNWAGLEDQHAAEKSSRGDATGWRKSR